MSLSTSSTQAIFIGNGTTGPFTFGFKFFDNADIHVYKTSALGVVTSFVEGQQYSLTGAGLDSGGAVTLSAALAVGEFLTVYRHVPLTQNTVLPDGGPFFASTHEKTFDRLTMQIQQIAEVELPTPTTFTSSVSASTYGTDLAQAISAIGEGNVDLVVNTAITVNANTTIPANINLSVTKSGLITIASGKTLTINGPFSAGRYQVFAGSGTVTGPGLTEAYPEWWGAGTDAFGKAVATGAHVKLAAGVYSVGAAVTTSTGQLISGSGKTKTTIKKAFNGDLLTMSEGSGIVDLTIDGEGATYTGNNINITGTNGRQYGRDCRVINSDGYAIEYKSTAAGSQDSWTGCHIARYNGTAPGRYAVKSVDAVAQTSPHKYTNIETDGGLFIDLGCGSFIVSNSYTGAYKFSDNTVACHISGGRIRGAVDETMEIKGSGNSIIGVGIFPKVIITEGTNFIDLSGCFYNQGITDNSGVASNIFDTQPTVYTSIWSSNGSAPDIGNGSIVALYHSQAGRYFVDITVTFGSTTNFGTGVYQFSVPVAPSQPIAQFGRARLVHSGVVADCYCIVQSTGTITIQFASIITSPSPVTATYSGTVQHNSPWTWAAGDTINIKLDYHH